MFFSLGNNNITFGMGAGLFGGRKHLGRFEDQAVVVGGVEFGLFRGDSESKQARVEGRRRW